MSHIFSVFVGSLYKLLCVRRKLREGNEGKRMCCATTLVGTRRGDEASCEASAAARLTSPGG